MTREDHPIVRQIKTVAQEEINSRYRSSFLTQLTALPKGRYDFPKYRGSEDCVISVGEKMPGGRRKISLEGYDAILSDYSSWDFESPEELYDALLSEVIFKGLHSNFGVEAIPCLCEDYFNLSKIQEKR
ncbi:MAG: hypothetical protein WCI72_01750 [archaeon]